MNGVLPSGVNDATQDGYIPGKKRRLIIRNMLKLD